MKLTDIINDLQEVLKIDGDIDVFRINDSIGGCLQLTSVGSIKKSERTWFDNAQLTIVREQDGDVNKQIKPCPFCGANNDTHNNIVKLYDEQFYAYTYCHKCGAHVYGDWNSRPLEDTLKSNNAKLEQYLNRLVDTLSKDENIHPPTHPDCLYPTCADCVECWRNWLISGDYI